MLLGSDCTLDGTLAISAGTIQLAGPLAHGDSSRVLVAKDANGTPGDGIGDAAIVHRAASGPHGYAGLGSAVANLDAGELPSTADLLDGSPSAAANVRMAWRTRTAREKTVVGGGLLSEVLDLGGIAPNGSGNRPGSQQTDAFVLQMSYDESVLWSLQRLTEAQAVAAQCLYLGYLDLGEDGLPASDDKRWQRAVDGNFGGVQNFLGDRAYDDSLFALGNYGVNTQANVVWAVVNHNSQFAAVPEPASIALAAIGGLCLLGYAWRRRRAGRKFQELTT